MDVCDVAETVQRLAVAPFGLPRAMELLVDSAAHFARRTRISRDHPSADRAFQQMGEALLVLIRRQYESIQVHQHDWDCRQLRHQIDAMVAVKAAAENVERAQNRGSSERGAHKSPFREAVRLLYMVVARHAAEITVHKIAAHRVPSELVKPILDFTAGDSDLLI